jgi:hypothetical protein
MYTKSKVVLAAALMFGFASAATAEDAAPDGIRANPNVSARMVRLIEGRNVFIPAPDRTIEERWFERASNVPTS